MYSDLVILDKAEQFALSRIGNKDFFIDESSMSHNPIGDYDLVARFILGILYAVDQHVSQHTIEMVCTALENCIYVYHMMFSQLCGKLIVMHLESN